MTPRLYALGLNQPMSSPMMTRMFGFAAAAGWAAAGAPSRAQAARARLAERSIGDMGAPFDLLECEDLLPVALHVDHGPAPGVRLGERLVELADRRGLVVRPLALRVGVMDEADEARPGPGGGPLQHLLVAVGVAEGEDRAAADELLDTCRLAG